MPPLAAVFSAALVAAFSAAPAAPSSALSANPPRVLLSIPPNNPPLAILPPNLVRRFLITPNLLVNAPKALVPRIPPPALSPAYNAVPKPGKILSRIVFGKSLRSLRRSNNPFAFFLTACAGPEAPIFLAIFSRAAVDLSCKAFFRLTLASTSMLFLSLIFIGVPSTLDFP